MHVRAVASIKTGHDETESNTSHLLNEQRHIFNWIINHIGCFSEIVCNFIVFVLSSVFCSPPFFSVSSGLCCCICWYNYNFLSSFRCVLAVIKSHGILFDCIRKFPHLRNSDFQYFKPYSWLTFKLLGTTTAKTISHLAGLYFYIFYFPNYQINVAYKSSIKSVLIIYCYAFSSIWSLTSIAIILKHAKFP